MSEIDVSKYFKNYRNEYGLTFAIEYIGNPKDLIREIKQQNELLISYKEENEKLKQGVKVSMEWTSECCKVCTFKEENEVLRHTIHEWQHDCNSKREKLEKIKEEIGENKELRCSLDMGKKILQIIEGDNNEYKRNIRIKN